MAECEYDVVVVGGGIAGLTAATVAAKRGLRTLVLEQLGPGGQLLNMSTIDSDLHILDQRPAAELAALTAERAMDAGAVLEFTAATALTPGKPHVVQTESGQVAGAAVILAMGSQPRPLAITGEHEFAGRGVSYCVSCDGPLFHGEPVALLGGGMFAVKEAHELCEFASEVIVISVDHSRWTDPLARHGNLRLIADASVVAIEGEADGVRSIQLSDGRHADVRAVFICEGYSPMSELVRGIVQLDSDGRIVTDNSLESNLPDVYAAGDIRTHAIQNLLTAAADGVMAATAVARKR